jgi:hypothetical protein
VSTYVVMDAPGYCGDYVQIYDVFESETETRARGISKDRRVLVVDAGAGGTHVEKGDRRPRAGIETLINRGDWKRVG